MKHARGALLLSFFIACFSFSDRAPAQQSSEAMPPPLPEGNQGIAASYPGDAGVARDPRVIFVDDYESGASKGDNVWGAVVYTKKPENVHSGTTAIELTLPWPRDP